MELVKISQYTALRLEHARKAGISESRLLDAVNFRDPAVFREAETEDFTYGDIFNYAEEHGEPLQQALQHGYRMTFNTRSGLKIWLEEAFRLDSRSDFTVGEGRIEGLRLTEAQLGRLKQALAVNWVIASEQAAADGVEVSLCLRALA
ncbi:MAG: hypothetical protein E7L01_30270 [Paenibacillus macerans]|uniref:Uncharacterized protein n=1 Tax=Paenibacillus macerans TaxID=44252 RepID=A0A090ZIU8_PAEMA|nr:hypothetical protein [Paenibacillus macerans]KFN10542.1 hypothetical protein DJ90_1069 [Paenibacillus macerans]MCY7562770.1 hypothetical protein [Paenibacillus macerans]MDU7477587.1 hypothetical protein [Paenibacillus macerans]MEC0151576.1 hypothetical protein [Paenibacillus macerans]MED4953840.1 hypothetical protein [Paenibacillus macerans]